MAILHVRGVPDELYEHIRQKARTERRSISGEVIQLLEQALGTSSERDPADAEYQRRKALLQQQAAAWYQERNRPMSQEEYTAIFDEIVRRADELAAAHGGPFPDSVEILRADRERDERRWANRP